MDIFHVLLLTILGVMLVFFRERKKRKLAEFWYGSARDRVTQLRNDLRAMAKAWLLSVIPAEKISYRPAEGPRLNFVYPPSAPEMLIARNLNEHERAIMDQIDEFFDNELRTGNDFSWFQIPGPVTEEERTKYSNQ